MTKQADDLSQLCRQFKIDILYIFGSRAVEVRVWLAGRGPQLPKGPSDIDVGAKLTAGRALSVYDKVKLALSLEEMFGVTRVDLVFLCEADPFLAANIIRGERLYASDSHLADEYDLYILRRAGDLAPFERERQALILGERP